ncbi:MAG: glycine cleavage system protein T, partial [Geminicoccaceae bacterium]
MLDAPSASPAHPLIGFGSRIRTSPYFDATVKAGARAWTVYNHMYMPLWYESPEADYRRLVEHASLWDVACERNIQISGPDADAFMQYLTPRNLTGCAVGQCKYILLTDEAGGVINDPVLLKLGEGRYWLSLADADVLLWARGLALGLNMDVTVDELDVSPLQLQGPKSADIMRDLFGDWVDELKFFWFRQRELAGIPLVVSRTGWSGERGYEIYLCDEARGIELWDHIMTVGRDHGLGPGAPSTIRRIEAGLLSYGADITRAENPFEVGLDRLVDLDMEADFVGKAALTRIRETGVRRRLVGLEIGGPRLAAPNDRPWPVVKNDQTIGRLTSCVFSLALGRN